MGQINTKHVWIGLAAILAVALAVAAPALFAGNAAPTAATGAGTQHDSSQGCSAMGGKDGTGGCSMSGSQMGMMGGMHHGCTMLTGKVTSVAKDGSIAVKVQPANDAEKSALAGVKVGDSLPLAIVNSAQTTGNTAAKTQTAQYTCPMHPEVASDKPGQCPKCGMNLEPVKK